MVPGCGRLPRTFTEPALPFRDAEFPLTNALFTSEHFHDPVVGVAI
jgi:hypothetical protein